MNIVVNRARRKVRTQPDYKKSITQFCHVKKAVEQKMFIIES